MISQLIQQYGDSFLNKSHVLHSGGWKKLQDLFISKENFNRQLSSSTGISLNKIIDYYGMIEQLGVIYPDCSHGNKHTPKFAEVIIRNPLNWEPCNTGETGIIQLISIVSPCFPGQSLLTEDMGTVIYNDNCPCGRRGIAFRFSGRVPKSEIRGCSNVSRGKT